MRRPGALSVRLLNRCFGVFFFGIFFFFFGIFFAFAFFFFWTAFWASLFLIGLLVTTLRRYEFLLWIPSTFDLA